MSLASLLTSSANHQRRQTTLDAAGAPSGSTFGTLSTGNPCCVWPVGSGEGLMFAQYSLTGGYGIVFASDLGVRSGDRIVMSDSTVYLVRGFLPFTSPMTGTFLYLVDADLFT